MNKPRHTVKISGNIAVVEIPRSECKGAANGFLADHVYVIGDKVTGVVLFIMNKFKIGWFWKRYHKLPTG